MPNGGDLDIPEGEELQPERGFGRPTRQAGGFSRAGRGARAAGQAAKAAGRAAVTAARAAVAAVAAMGPVGWIALGVAALIIIIGLIIGFGIFGVCFGDKCGKTVAQETDLTSQKHVDELLQLLASLNLDETATTEQVKKAVQQIQEKVNQIGQDVSTYGGDAQSKYQKLKDLSDSLSNFVDVPVTPTLIQNLNNTIKQIIAAAQDLRKAVGALVFTDAERAEILQAIDSAMDEGTLKMGADNRQDIFGGKIQDSLLRFIAEATNHAKNNGYKIIISTTRSDHEKNTTSGNISNHYRGLAIDISNEGIAPQIMPWIFNNREDLRIAESIGPSAYKQYQVKHRQPHQYGGGVQAQHENHIHVAIEP